MDSKTYKETIAADPSAPFDHSGLSADERAAADAFRDEMLLLDAKIIKALSIDVPGMTMPELPAIGEGSNVVDMPKKKKPALGVPAWIGIAASFAIVALFGARFLGEPATYPSLAAELVAHLDHEPQALRVTSVAVSERTLAKVVSTGRAEIDAGVGLVTYARTCTINGKSVPHLVIQGKLGPITLLLLPDEQVDRAVPVEGAGINGVILPVGDGSIAIIGERDENLSEIEQQVIDSVTWSI